MFNSPDIFLSKIFIYPIKSFPGVRLDEAKCVTKGLEHDRRWMLVDNKNKFISLREERKLLKFSIKQFNLGFDISASDHKATIQMPLTLEEGVERKVKIWDDEVVALEGNLDWNDWFSEVLGRPVSIVYFPEENERKIKDKWQVKSESVSFADGYPYLVVGQSSLDTLNAKLSSPIGVERFRPNLVFAGGEDKTEFYWKDFSIGEVKFKGLKPCARCVVTTIDSDTGVADKEPLKTLAKERVDNKIVFGQHALSLNEGTIKLGDKVSIDQVKESPYDTN